MPPALVLRFLIIPKLPAFYQAKKGPTRDVMVVIIELHYEKCRSQQVLLEFFPRFRDRSLDILVSVAPICTVLFLLQILKLYI